MNYQERAKQYKNTLASRYKLVSEKDIPTLPECLNVSIKYDGQLFLLIQTKQQTAFLINGSGVVLDADEIDIKIDTDAAFIAAGELFTKTQGRERVFQVSQLLGRNGDKSQLTFKAFDLLEYYSEKTDLLTFEEKQEVLQKVLPNHHVKQQVLNHAQIKDWFDIVSKTGWEGLVCVDSSVNKVYKLKPAHTVDAVVIGYTLSEQGIKSILTALMRQDGTLQEFAKIGSGFSVDDRKHWYHKLEGATVKADFHVLDSEGQCFVMTEPKHIIEIEFHDLIPSKRSLMTFNDDNYQFNSLFKHGIAALGARLVRERTDKAYCRSDIRIEQLIDLTDIDLSTPEKKQLAPSAVLRREVLRKGDNVRKFITWKTNKQQVGYPPYAVCFTDFSPTRKEPLKRSLFGVSTETEALELMSELKDKNTTRGWQLMSI